jgi:hypothetical protein
MIFVPLIIFRIILAFFSVMSWSVISVSFVGVFRVEVFLEAEEGRAELGPT